MLADIIVALAGYATEKMKYGTTSSGVSGDFQQAMRVAHTMVWRLGMGTGGFVGDYSIIPENQISSNLKERLNNETIALLNECLGKVEVFLKQEWPLVETIARELMEKDELDYDVIEALFKGQGKFKDNAGNLLSSQPL